MDFLNYIKGLLPSFGRNEIVESAALACQDLSQKTLPAMRIAAELLGPRKMASKKSEQYCAGIKKELKSKNAFTGMVEALENAVVIMGYVETHNKRIFAETETNQGLTYSKATVLRVIQAATFASTYARRLLLLVYQEEANEVLKESTGAMSPKELAWVDEGYADFLICLRVLATPAATFEDFLKKVPESTISEMSEQLLTTTVGVAKIDPLALSHLSVKVNPFYLFGMMVAQWQAANYKTINEEINLLQLRVMQLEKLNDKANDAGLQREIAYNQERITALRARKDNMEKDYAL